MRVFFFEQTLAAHPAKKRTLPNMWFSDFWCLTVKAYFNLLLQLLLLLCCCCRLFLLFHNGKAHIHTERPGAEANVAFVEPPQHQGVARCNQNPLTYIELEPLTRGKDGDGAEVKTRLARGFMLGHQKTLANRQLKANVFPAETWAHI